MTSRVAAIALILAMLDSSAEAQQCPPGSSSCPLPMARGRIEPYVFMVRPGKVPPFRTAARLTTEQTKGKRTLIHTGSGVVVRGDASYALILTAEHVVSSSDPAHPVKIELFDATKGPDASASLGPPIAEYQGFVVAADTRLDVALVNFAPGRQLPESEIAPREWSPDGKPLVSIGCTHGANATAWSEKILRDSTNTDGSLWYLTATRPIEGRSGGGLFNLDGQVVGICHARDSLDGIYAHNRSIRLVYDQVVTPTRPTPTPLPSLPTTPNPLEAMPQVLGGWGTHLLAAVSGPSLLAVLYGAWKLLKGGVASQIPASLTSSTPREVPSLESLMPLIAQVIERKKQADAAAETAKATAEKHADLAKQIEALLNPPPPN